MSVEEYTLIEESDGTFSVVMGKETRPPSPEPPSSPCPEQHVIKPLGEKEGWHGGNCKEAVVRAVHSCSRLNAAVIMNDESTVKHILATSSSSEEFERLDCTGSPPICEAAYHNRLSIMALLLDSVYANVNTVNHLGLSPLCIAAGNTLDNPKMTEMLLGRKANINVRAKDGRSPLHIAAEGGHLRIVRRLLSSNDVHDSILFSSYRDSEIYCPPPAILAAANDHELVVSHLLKYQAHPCNILRDIKLLFWARKVLSVAVSGRNMFADDDAIVALQMEQVSISERLSPIPAYGNIQEFTTVEEIKNYASLPVMERVCAYVCQSLVILERNVGLSNKLVSSCMIMASNVFRMHGQHNMVELLFLRIFEGFSLMERLILNRGFSMMPSHLHITLSFFLVVQFWNTIKELTKANYQIMFQPFIVGLANDLDIILKLKGQQPCQRIDHWGEAFQTDFIHLLALVACALLGKRTSCQQGKGLDEIGYGIVLKYEKYATTNFTSLVHLALRKAKGITEILKCSGMGGKKAMIAYSLLIEALIHWGCSKFLNVPFMQFFCKGELPLHMAVRLAEMDPCYVQVVDMLMSHGAHYDGVASSGLIPSRIATREHLKACFDLTPLPLACLASNAAVNHQLRYQESPYLPPTMKRFISYHDPTLIKT